MNPDNYGTQPACQRLVEKGIVLKTDALWVFYSSGNSKLIYTKDKGPTFANSKEFFIPAPSMVEVWRELRRTKRGNLFMAQMTDDNDMRAWMEWTTFDGFGKCSPVFENVSSTDVLISLLIWLKEQGKEVTK
jgi:hypothetical protein